MKCAETGQKNNTQQQGQQTQNIIMGDLDELISDVSGVSGASGVNGASSTSSTSSTSSPSAPTAIPTGAAEDQTQTIDFLDTGMAAYNPNDSPRIQCRALFKMVTVLQHNQRILIKTIKNLEHSAMRPHLPPRVNALAAAQNLPERIKQMFPNVKHYDKPEMTALDLSPQAMMELYNQHGDNTVDELIKMIWFNRALPQNHSIFLLNPNTDETVYFKDAWRKDKLKNIIPVMLGVLDNFIGIGLTTHVTVNHAAFSIQAKRAREQFMSVRQSFKNPVTTKGAVPAYIGVYYEKIKDIAETMSEEILRGVIQ